jgi:hypothetical protein
MSWLTDMFHPTNPADKAMPYLDALPDELKQYFQKYMNYGDNAYNMMNPVLSQMLTDPGAYMNKLMAGYAPSTQYKLDENAMTKAAANSAAAGGMRGSSQDINNEAKITDRLMGNDMQQWLQNAMRTNDTALQGYGHLFDTGFNANQAYAGDLGNIRGSQAQLAFQGQREANQNKNDFLKALIGAAAVFGGQGLGGQGGGSIFGGPGGIGDMFSSMGGYNYGSPSGNTYFPDFNTSPGGWM